MIYILKKSEIIRLTAFVLILVLLGGISPVFSEDVEKNEAISSNLNEAAYFPLSEICVYAPVSLLLHYSGLDLEVLYKIGSISIDAKNEALPFAQASEDNIISGAMSSKTIATDNDNKVSRTAYLTFDDGLDSKVTPQILDILKSYDVKATFFILGNSVNKNKDILKRMVDEGHSIGNHTYTHKKDIIYTDVKSFSNELARTSNEIYDAVAINTKLFRPPYGAPYIRSREYKAALSQYKIVLWNVDSMDSRVKNISGSEIATAVKDQLKNKSNAIILFHSTSARQETVKALPEIIEYLIDNGYSITRFE